MLIKLKQTMKRFFMTSTVFTLLSLGSIACIQAQLNLDASVPDKYENMDELPKEEPKERLDYMVDTWSSPMTREAVEEITSILYFWRDNKNSKYKVDNFTEVWVANLKDYPDWQLDVDEIEPHLKAMSPTTEYTKEQLAIIENAEYNDHLRFSARFNSTKIETGEVEEYKLISQSMSLVPEVQASYKGGMEALVDHLKKHSHDVVSHVKRDKVGRCRIFFKVTERGTIDEVRLVESSNYPEVDESLIELVKDIPRKWKPAKTEQGEKVAQEFVFTFGRAGC